MRSFKLLNQRRDVAFLLFYNVSQATRYSSANLLARSAAITLRDPNAPQHIHLALSQAEGYRAFTSLMMTPMHAGTQ